MTEAVVIRSFWDVILPNADWFNPMILQELFLVPGACDTPAMKCLGLYATYTYTHSRITDLNFEGRENEKGLSLPGSPEHTANLSLYFDKCGFSARASFNYASAFIDEMGASSFYDRYYDAVKYMDLNVSYTFGRKTKITVYADCNNLLNQPLRYYQGSKDYTMQQEYYGVKLNGGVKVTF